MKKVILISIFCLLVTCPVYAYEIDSTQSIEGTVWAHHPCIDMMGCYYTGHIGFYNGLLYEFISNYNCFVTPNEIQPAGYIDLSDVGLFWYTGYCLPNNPSICQRPTGVLFSSIEKGMRWCTVIPCRSAMHKLELVPDMSLPEDICAEGIRDHVITRDPEMGSECRNVPIPTDKFYDHDEAAYCWVFYLASSQGDEYRCMWYKPNGELYHEGIILSSHEVGCWYSSISIKGDSPATTLGEWHVDVYLNGIKEFTKYFTIVASDYEYIELLPPGWTEAQARFINDNGVVVGRGHDGTAYRGFIYSDGEYTEVLPPPGWDSATPECINDRGEVVGGGDDGNQSTNKGFLYSEGQYTEIFPPGWNANVNFINNNGVIVGGEYHPSSTTSKGFIYSNGIYTELLPPGWNKAEAYCINDSGAVVGELDLSLTDERSSGFIYNAGKYTELLPPGWSYARALYINNNGVVVGEGYDLISRQSKGFIYSNGIYTELLPPGWNYAYAIAINDSGVVLGQGEEGTIQKGFVYSEGEYTELFPPWSNSNYVTSVNNSGVVVGEADDKGFIALPKF